MSLAGKLRFLIKAETQDEAPSVMLKPDDLPLDWDLPTEPREPELLMNCKFQQRQLAENAREGAARPSLGTSFNNLAALYICTGRRGDALRAMYEANQTFAEMPLFHPPSGKYDLVGRAVVGYNASVLARLEGNLEGSKNYREEAARILEQVPEGERDQEFEFVQSALAAAAT